MATGTLAGPLASPVSYTHLDVYKRQLLDDVDRSNREDVTLWQNVLSIAGAHPHSTEGIHPRYSPLTRVYATLARWTVGSHFASHEPWRVLSGMGMLDRSTEMPRVARRHGRSRCVRIVSPWNTRPAQSGRRFTTSPAKPACPSPWSCLLYTSRCV